MVEGDGGLIGDAAAAEDVQSGPDREVHFASAGIVNELEIFQ